MPLYEYECNDCKEIIEKLVKLDGSNAPNECPKCNGSVHKIMSVSRAKFIGSGFYQTDFKNK